MILPSDNDEATLESYDRFAPAYADLYYATRGLDAEMDAFFSLLPPHPTLLDAGCGPGHLALYLSAKGAWTAGLDYSFPMLVEGKRRNPDNPLLAGDMRSLPFKDGSFDGVWARASLIHLDREGNLLALREFRRVLKPDGILYAAVREGRGETLRKETQKGVDLSRYFHFWTEAEWHQSLSDEGFDLLEHGIEEGSPENWLWVHARCKVLLKQ